MSIRKRLLTSVASAAVAFGLLFLGAGSASAAPGYPPATETPVVTIDSGVLQPGQSVTLSFTGFQPFETITIVVFSDPVNLGTYNADGNGDLTVTVTLPAGLEPGPHTIVATGASGVSASFGFTVPSGIAFTGGGSGGSGGTGNTGGSGLAYTGIAIGGSLVIAVGLLTAGTVTLLAGRRRNMAG